MPVETKQFCRTAHNFAIDEVPDADENDSNGNAGNRQIKKTGKLSALSRCVKPGSQGTAADGTVKRKAPLIDSDHGQKIAAVMAPVCRHINQASSNDPANHHEKHQIINKIFVVTHFQGVSAQIIKTSKDGNGHEKTVPPNCKRPDGKRHRI